MCTSLSGDVLIFMPGQEEIEVTCEVLAGAICVILCMYTCIHTCVCTIYVVFLNQAHAGHRAVHAWFLKIVSMRMSVCVFVCLCVCVCPRGY